MNCFTCDKELTINDFVNEEEAILCSPRAFIGEDFSNFCWKIIPIKNGKTKSIERSNLCKKHRKNFTMVRVFENTKIAKEWIETYFVSLVDRATRF